MQKRWVTFSNVVLALVDVVDIHSLFRLQDSTILHINVMDINDNSPEFVPKPSEMLSAYIRSIDEGSGSVGMVVVYVNATDRDSGPNAEIRYSISGDENGYFKIDSFTVCVKNIIYIQFSLVSECCFCDVAPTYFYDN